jgi:hypothetical protein
LKFKPYNLLCTNQLARISFKLPNYLVSYYSGTVAATMTLRVSQPPPNRNLVLRFGKSSGSNRNSEQKYNSSLRQDKVWMARMEDVLDLPCCFFFRVVALLYLEEHDCFAMFLLLLDLDRVLGVRQVSLEQCHFGQHDVHRCPQTLLQLLHVEDVMNSS